MILFFFVYTYLCNCKKNSLELLSIILWLFGFSVIFKNSSRNMKTSGRNDNIVLILSYCLIVEIEASQVECIVLMT